VPAISHNLLHILRLLKEEEKFDNNFGDHEPLDITTTGTLSESMEFFI
jgi:hypothetical protein